MVENPYLAQRHPVWEPLTSAFLTIGPSITHQWDPIPDLAPMPPDFRWVETELNIPVAAITFANTVSPAMHEPPWWRRG